MEIYHQCIHGNYQEVERLKQKYESRSNAVSSSRADGSSDDEDDNDVDNDQDDDDNDDDNAMVGLAALSREDPVLKYFYRMLIDPHLPNQKSMMMVLKLCHIENVDRM